MKGYIYHLMDDHALTAEEVLASIVNYLSEYPEECVFKALDELHTRLHYVDTGHSHPKVSVVKQDDLFCTMLGNETLGCYASWEQAVMNASIESYRRRGH